MPADAPETVPIVVRRSAVIALCVAILHIIFGAIVRISGSGMGCGDNWPKCDGYWFPPLQRPDLIVEVSHRYLASILSLTIVILVFNAWRYRQRVGVGAKAGVWHTSLLAAGTVVVTALFGAVTVFTGNPAWATVVHQLLAVSLIAVLLVAVIRSGAFGTIASLRGHGQSRAVGATMAAAVMALLVVVLGGLTAKIPGAAVACAGFPLCGAGSLGGAGQHMQLTHRILAYLLVLHLCSLPFIFRKRAESSVLQRLAWLGLLLGVLQVVWAAVMVMGGFPPVIRSLHQATGVLIWSTAFSMAYVARIASGRSQLASRGAAATDRAIVGGLHA
ncbi:MAG: COX15/CtaA family protein [Gemmatimonadota bacterium]|nr:COX15/CtaA family protein [Gemmatimonadota bacterium]